MVWRQHRTSSLSRIAPYQRCRVFKHHLASATISYSSTVSNASPTYVTKSARNGDIAIMLSRNHLIHIVIG